jgi:hypothetical protein
MQEISDIVNVKGIELVNRFRADIGAAGQNATLRTSQSLRFEIVGAGTKVSFKLFGRAFFMTVYTGRKPTPEKKPSRDMIQNLIPWVEARGIDESAVWAIATNIQLKGTKLWRDGGRMEDYESIVDTFINDVSTSILESEADNFILKVRQEFNGNGS